MQTFDCEFEYLRIKAIIHNLFWCQIKRVGQFGHWYLISCKLVKFILKTSFKTQFRFSSTLAPQHVVQCVRVTETLIRKGILSVTKGKIILHELRAKGVRDNKAPKSVFGQPSRMFKSFEHKRGACWLYTFIQFEQLKTESTNATCKHSIPFILLKYLPF